MMSSRAQSAFELLIIIGVIVVFFTTFLIVMLGDMSDLHKKKESLLIKDIAMQVQTEINLASKSSEGYSREFKIPGTIDGNEYEINITDSRVFVRTSQNSISLNVEECQGDVIKGTNIIRKINGVIYLNQ